jgi:hypothetical protein
MFPSWLLGQEGVVSSYLHAWRFRLPRLAQSHGWTGVQHWCSLPDSLSPSPSLSLSPVPLSLSHTAAHEASVAAALAGPFSARAIHANRNSSNCVLSLSPWRCAVTSAHVRSEISDRHGSAHGLWTRTVPRPGGARVGCGPTRRVGAESPMA